jgi:hypothetical protein
MDERALEPAATEIPRPQPALRPTQAGSEHPLDDGRALTILTTEHWSLLSARGLVYNEAFARGGMFLTFLSATLVALGLISTGTGFSKEFLGVVAGVFALDLFIGVATLVRIADATGEDIHYLQGMNRLRHAYHETVPGLERYFISSPHDDARGVFPVYSANPDLTSRPGLLHGFTTTVGMVGVIDAAVGAVLVGDILLLVGAGTALVLAVAFVAFGAGVGTSFAYMVRHIKGTVDSLQPIFPTPGPHDAMPQ